MILSPVAVIFLSVRISLYENLSLLLTQINFLQNSKSLSCCCQLKKERKWGSYYSYSMTVLACSVCVTLVTITDHAYLKQASKTLNYKYLIIFGM